MTTATLEFSAFLGTIFGLLAGACAFVIAYNEYRRNWAFTGNPVRAAMRSAIVTFFLFLIAAIVLPWLVRATLPGI